MRDVVSAGTDSWLIGTARVAVELAVVTGCCAGEGGLVEGRE